MSWSYPFDGGSVITDYDVRYKKTTDTTWTDWPTCRHGHGPRPLPIWMGVTYQVQVQATNVQGTGLWSVSGVGAPFIDTLYASRLANNLYRISTVDASKTLVGNLGNSSRGLAKGWRG